MLRLDQFRALVAFGQLDQLPQDAAHDETESVPWPTIRHSFAMGLRQSGADIADIQDIYGHTNPQTTQIYARKDLKKHKKAIRQLRTADGRAAVKLASKERETLGATKPGITTPDDRWNEI